MSDDEMALTVVDKEHAWAIKQMKKEGHLWSGWYAWSRSHKYRTCVVPGCNTVEVVEANG